MFVSDVVYCVQVIFKSTSENGSLSNTNVIYHVDAVHDFSILVQAAKASKPSESITNQLGLHQLLFKAYFTLE
jgi:hypothetical protein